jgi:hypothetical protein
MVWVPSECAVRARQGENRELGEVMWALFGLLYVATFVALLLTVTAGVPWVSVVVVAAVVGVASFAWLTR